MKILKLLAVFAVVGLFLTGCEDELKTNDFDQPNQDMVLNGNGAPNGAHYNLNIIGVPKGKTADMDGNNGHRIFVSLQGKTKINLGPGDDFQVLDANGTDSDGATLQLPDDVATSYTVWARAVGKPGGSVTITTCGELWDEDDYLMTVCSDEPVTLTRNKKEAPKFRDVSRNLLYVIVYEDIMDGDEVLLEAGEYPLFDDALENYFWDYDNNGLKVLQLRFYPNVD